MPAPRAFIIHGYLSYPEEAWLPWMKAELEKRNYAVALPAMPAPDCPIIPEWIAFVAKLVGEPDEATVMIGHSMGCQAVIRYLETLGNAGKSVGRTVLVAGGFPPNLSPAEAGKRIHGNTALLPWFTTGVDPGKVKSAAGKCTVILSDDDPYLNVAQTAASFRVSLDPEIVIESGRGHFNEDDKVLELPAALKAAVS